MCEPPGSSIPSENSRHAETVSTQQVVFVPGELVHQPSCIMHRVNKEETQLSQLYFWRKFILENALTVSV